METTTKENGLAIIEQVPVITKSLPEALNLNQSSLVKAKDFGEKLFSEISQKGMSDDYDKQVNDYLVKLKSTCKTVNERRAPITKFFDEIKKAFTAIESELDQKSELYTKFQKLRDGWAEKKRKEEIERQRQIQLKADQEKEKIEVRAKIELDIRKEFNELLASDLKIMLCLLESANLETFGNVLSNIGGFAETCIDRICNYNTIPLTQFITIDEATEILVSVKATQIFKNLDLEYQQAIKVKKAELIAKLPAKKAELEKIAKAGAEEKKRLQAEAEERKKAEEKRIADENAKKLADEQVKINANAQAETANTLFNVSMENGEASKVAQGIESYELAIWDHKAYPLIFQFWWAREGQYETPEKIQKKTISQMIGFAEKWAKAKGEKIQSDSLEYKPVYKTVAKK